MQLRPFQAEDIDLIVKAQGRALVASAPGVGKTVIALGCLNKSYPGMTPALVVAPASVTTNWSREAKAWSPWAKSFVVEGETGRIPRNRQLYICSWSLLDARADELSSLGLKCVIADECFPAGTLISLADGKRKPIEKIVPGDVVWSVNLATGQRVPRPVIEAKPTALRKELLQVDHEAGTFFCTPDHRIWTEEEGYVRAECLRGHHLRVLRGERAEAHGERSASSLLQSELLGSLAGEAARSAEVGAGGAGQSCDLAQGQPAQATRCGEAHAGEQSDVESCDCREDAREAGWADLPCARREREGNAGAGPGSAGSWSPHGAPDSDVSCVGIVQESPAVLQGGHRVAGSSDCDRDRRSVAYAEEVALLGQAQDRDSQRSRVVCTTLHERGSSSGPSESPGNDPWVYDLEVEETHNFFADGVLVSNCHFAKNPDSNRSLALSSILEGVPGRILLSGTPIVNNEDELRVLYDLLGVAKPLMIRRLLEDVAPEIPPKTRGYVHVQLPPKVLAEYRKIEKDFAEWLEDRLASLDPDAPDEVSEQALAAEALVKMGYLRRTLAAGKVHAASDWAARAVRLGEPVVLFAEHQEVIQKLCRQLRKHRLRYVLVDGNTPRLERQAAIDAFQRGDVPIFVGSKAAKEGITLTRAANLLFCERWYTAAEEEQAEDRIRRIGQTRATKVWFLHAPDTIDDRLAEIVETKRHIVREAIGAKEIEESDVDAVRRLLHAWGRKAGVPRASPDAPVVGYGAPELPPLPSPRDTFAVDFATPDPKRAIEWAKMNGYHPIRIEAWRGGWRVLCHEATRFVPGQFRAVRLSSDIRLVTGRRS